MAFEFFSRFSGRAFYIPVMHKINDRMPESSLSSKMEVAGPGPVDGWLDGIYYEGAGTFSDFFIPSESARNHTMKHDWTLHMD